MNNFQIIIYYSTLQQSVIKKKRKTIIKNFNIHTFLHTFPKLFKLTFRKTSYYNNKRKISHPNAP